jgi:predicted neuraminidase
MALLPLLLALCASALVRALPLPFDGLVRAQPDGSAVAYMSPPNLANHASSLEQLPDGTLLLAWFSGLKEEADKCAIALSRLLPGSSQWSSPVLVSERDGFSNQNPVLFHDASTGVTWLFHSQLAAGAGEGLDNLWVLQSTDSGASWSRPAPFLDMSKDKKGVFDRNRLIPRADGSLLFPLYWTTEGPPNAPFMLISGASNHSSWGKPVDVKSADNLVQPTIVRTSPGTLKAFFRDRKSRSVFGATSADEGLTWSTPTPAAAGGLPNNVREGREWFRLSPAWLIPSRCLYFPPSLRLLPALPECWH